MQLALFLEKFYERLCYRFFFIHDFIWNNNSIYVEPHCSATHAEFLLFFLQLLKHVKNVYFLPITSIWSSEHSPDKTSIWRSSEIDTMDWLKTQISLNLSYFFFFAHSFHHTYTQTHTWAILFFFFIFCIKCGMIYVSQSFHCLCFCHCDIDWSRLEA